MTAKLKNPTSTTIINDNLVKNISENFETEIQAKKPRFSLEVGGKNKNICIYYLF